MITGGLRTRYISDSVRVGIIAALEALGWFDDGRRHAPLEFAAKPEEWMEVVALNTFSITMEDLHEDESELGGVAVDDTHTFFFDFYAENDSLGRHLAWDVHDIAMGKFPSIGRHSPVFDLYDFQAATPAALHQLEVERVAVQKVDGFPRPWQRYWWTVRIDVIDDRAEDSELMDGVAEWDAELEHAWTLAREII